MTLTPSDPSAAVATAGRQPVFIAFQDNHDTRPIIDAVREDNPEAEVQAYPGMVKINAPGRLVIRRSSIETQIGREFDLREIYLNLISLSGEVDESADDFTLQWG